MDDFLRLLLIAVLTILLQPIWNDCWPRIRKRVLAPLSRRFNRAWRAFWRDI